MGNQLTDQSTIALIHTLKTQGQQSEALADLLTEVSGIKNKMEETAKEVQEHVEESRAILDKVTEQVTINYDEQRELKSLISKKADGLTREHFRVTSKAAYSDNLFKAWKGLFTRRMHSKLKQRMNIVRYTSLKRIDFDEAMEYLNSIVYVGFSAKDLEPTPAILKVIDLDDIA